jgi:hypothetical protein
MGRECSMEKGRMIFFIKLWFEILRITGHVGGADCCGLCLNVLLQFNPLKAELNPICHLLMLLGNLTFMGPCIVSIHGILIYVYIQQDATLHSLFISGNCSTCFGWYFHPSSGAYATHNTLKPVPTLPR